jgi:hypothetical protein
MNPFEFEPDNLLSRASSVGLESETDDLARAIERQIQQDAFGQILGLHVSRLGDAIVLHGHCRTYYSSRIAHQAAAGLVDGSTPLIDMITID